MAKRENAGFSSKKTGKARILVVVILLIFGHMDKSKIKIKGKKDAVGNPLLLSHIPLQWNRNDFR